MRWLFLEPGFDHPRLKGTQRLDAPRYTPNELRAEAGPDAPTKVVHIQCANTADPVQETRWLEELAAVQGGPDAIVAGARLREPGVGQVIAANAASPRFRGVRDLSVQGGLDLGDVAEAFEAAAEHGASIEVMVPPAHYGMLVAWAQRWPEVTIVLGHGGQPERRSADYLADWSTALRRLADTTVNVVLKISAIASSADPEWTEDSIRPWVLAAIDAFGPPRCMLASNWPIDRLYGSYPRLLQAYQRVTAGLDERDRNDVWHATADRTYRV